MDEHMPSFVVGEKNSSPHLELKLLLLTIGMLVVSADAATLRELSAGAAPQERTYKTIGDVALKLYYFVPPDPTNGQSHPAVVWIHGGGWVGGTLDGFMPHARYMAARGAVGFNIEYRLLKPDGPLIGDCIADCKSAIRYIRSHAKELGVDPTKIAVAGDSAGGHLAAALGTLEGFDDPADDLSVSARPDAMLLFNPVLDLTEGNWIRSANGGMALADKKSPLPTSEKEVAVARSLSPGLHVLPGQPPTLLMHGADDKVVPAAQSQRFADAMKLAENRCELTLLPNTGHAFAVAFYKSPESVVVDVLRTSDRFLTSLGWFTGKPMLEISDPPAWEPKH